MRHLTIAFLSLLMAAGSTQASSLRVSPVGLTINPGTATSTIRVWNNDKRPLGVQVRVFRSKTVAGEEWLEPTRDVVASPPITTLSPGGENLVRIVRITKTPVGTEERYRLLVDELPDPNRRKAGTINVLVRHSIPVRFEGEQ
ncbi:hypothetical protein Sa4125_34600 [Aureimonas sp. SA4125]|uniref:fimbrial biogenesis chaperone n=1 Tax=Aureimonas sp. SA4125 TaxID=2826993 RepID=UPI001CC51DE5|nr:fimbria/pilus periplasmic chaperone [Aureimonas sp. SA4125]BDA85918.1 hypothetical protein Sa4125_34600 [Aureimonas sp. SA4125]